MIHIRCFMSHNERLCSKTFCFVINCLFWSLADSAMNEQKNQQTFGLIKISLSSSKPLKNLPILIIVESNRQKLYLFEKLALNHNTFLLYQTIFNWAEARKWYCFAEIESEMMIANLYLLHKKIISRNRIAKYIKVECMEKPKPSNNRWKQTISPRLPKIVV